MNSLFSYINVHVLHNYYYLSVCTLPQAVRMCAWFIKKLCVHVRYAMRPTYVCCMLLYVPLLQLKRVSKVMPVRHQRNAIVWCLFGLCSPSHTRTRWILRICSLNTRDVAEDRLAKFSKGREVLVQQCVSWGWLLRQHQESHWTSYQQ